MGLAGYPKNGINIFVKLFLRIKISTTFSKFLFCATTNNNLNHFFFLNKKFTDNHNCCLWSIAKVLMNRLDDFQAKTSPKYDSSHQIWSQNIGCQSLYLFLAQSHGSGVKIVFPLSINWLSHDFFKIERTHHKFFLPFLA